MTGWVSTERVIADEHTCARDGQVRVVWAEVFWLFGHGALGLIGLVFYFQLDAIPVFLGLTGLTICAGHSVGMHRLLIHRSFRTPKSVEYLLVWLGVLVGMAGPLGMIRKHDMRDWHQRQSVCPPHPSHAAGFWRDAWWQLCCTFDLKRPPEFRFEAEVSGDPVYALIERFWRWQGLPLALLLYLLGGWAFVCWGVGLRVFVSLVGHWMVGHFSHRGGHQGWRVEGLPVQGYNLPRLWWLTFGECYHGNHHAFPHSASLGVEPGQYDPGFWFIRGLERLGLAWDVRNPESEAPRTGLRRV